MERGEIKDGHYYFKVQNAMSGWGDQDTNNFIRSHTTYDSIKRRCDSHPDDEFFGYRVRKGGHGIGEYIWVKNKEVLELVDAFAATLIHTLKLKKGDSLGFISRNRYEWYVSQFAAQKYGIIPVPLYATLGEQAIDYIVDLMQIKHVVCSLDKTVAGLEKRKNFIQFIIFDHEKVDGVEVPNNSVYFEDLLNEGRSLHCDAERPNMDDLALCIFTSGTSGKPKGVMHTFSTFAHGITSINECNIFTQSPSRNETIFSYLPCAHILEQQTSQGFMFGGGRVGFISGGIASLSDDLFHCKPTYLAVVPRVLQRIYDTFNHKFNEMGCLAQTLFNVAYYFKRESLVNGNYNYLNFDFIFSKVRDGFGGKLRFIFNGGAPITPALFEWLRVCTGAHIMQSYGLTESCGGCTSCLPNMNDPNVISCGSPCDRVSLRLTSVPEMEYFIDSVIPCGEVELKGGPIFKGYFHNPTETENAFTEDGYFKTGDIGSVAKDGAVTIIDRKKNLFKLSQGEYIAVEPLEGKYDACEFVGQSFIYGESTDSFIVGVIVPNFRNVQNWLKQEGKDVKDNKEICQLINGEFKDRLLEKIHAFMKEMKVPGYELIRNVYFVDEEFSTENDLITPSFKLKRMNLKKKFMNKLTELRKQAGAF
ncbi:long-chain-fatty-acid--CoA ligase, putative [Entamoeba invadens IP1]|uniref:Long-chain-fatty-acid--CoA ligase, putative n=1 Tax=Entamoeba invadens IP1 TaxID=370355 RepID=A0A0A1UGF5_ENTIV|nr:long-chain-fatty-acid--CoA ligase, putative [Entamoeba invadens IP1]ELP92622.1 long-chain-fatty-acid--CoA ligase, putative [Entamoeba invadens IP1]|eukprot:XP_004259393.1 long-chain-fatty-acid--CoA ligase, putative [Entamoeba invadens IP1]